MAEKRMFSKKITDSDAFIELSSAAQSLYFHLNQSADDDGFNNQIQLAMLKSHASVDDLKVLLLKNFLIRFESGVIVIKHWRMHNTLRKDRHTPTSFQDELALLNIKDNLSYTLADNGCQLVAERLPSGCRSIDKISIDKISKEKSIGQKRTVFTPPTLEQVKEYCSERNNGVDAERFIDFYSCKGWMVGKNKMKDWKAAIRTWERGDNDGRPGTSSKPKESDNSKYNGMVL